MNRGLKAARGEYIGIVESDDFADKNMFERLYAIAKEHDVDVVKSNFYTHATIENPEEDRFVESLKGCPYDRVFSPLDEQDVFSPSPAIWSALYRRAFLEDKKISFSETPGASFQDTSFNFKVLASAGRVYLTKDAFLHYRIDNENSSVKSLSKVFCICEEYEEIWRFARANAGIFSRLKTRIPQVQFNGYLWNLGRLTPALQHDFYARFVKEYRAFETAGLLDKASFGDSEWKSVCEILLDSEGYFRNHYGPLEVSQTFIALISRRAKSSYKSIISHLVEIIGENDELYVLLEGSIVKTREFLKKSNLSDVRIHCAEGQISSVILGRLDMEEVRGRRIGIVQIGGPNYSVKSLDGLFDIVRRIVSGELLSNVADGWMCGSWDAENLAKRFDDVLIPLLFAGFYESRVNIFTADAGRIIEDWIGKEPISLSDMQSAYASFDAAFAVALERMKAVDYAVKKRFFSIFGTLWNELQKGYGLLEYGDRIEFGEKPSSLHYDPLVFVKMEGCVEAGPDVSVIIPVYNVAPYIRTCLASVLSQNLPSMEVICIDDGSTDGSLEILEQYAEADDRILVMSQFNGGAGSARNRGIEMARGEYLAFIDPDDYYPEAETLNKLLSAAKAHGVRISGGSFESFFPDGTKQKYFGGAQSFYTIRKEGLATLSDMGTDYGWIRFLYHRSIFDEGGVRFPEYRWYEDPVFLLRVMSHCNEYYGIEDVVYCYRENYKETSWDVVKTRDMVRGIKANMEFAKRCNYANIYSALVSRLDCDYLEPLIKHLDDGEVFASLVSIQSTLDLSLLNAAVEGDLREYTIKPLKKYREMRDTAVVRLAKRAQKSSLYKALQSFR